MSEAIDRDPGSAGMLEGAHEITAAAIRPHPEPLQFDCALHYDEDVARAHGYENIVAPVTSMQTFSMPPVCRPGETVFTTAERNAPLQAPGLSGFGAPGEPPTTGFIVTDCEAESLRPVVVGDRLRRRGARLPACVPKRTRLGKDAFLTWETAFVNQRDEVVARSRTTRLRYEPDEARR